MSETINFVLNSLGKGDITLYYDDLECAFKKLQEKFPNNPKIMVWKGKFCAVCRPSFYILPQYMNLFILRHMGSSEVETLEWRTFDSFGEAFDFVRKAKEQLTE